MPHRSRSSAGSSFALLATVATAFVLALATIAVLLARDQARRHRDVDARLGQQAVVGAAMIAALRDTTVASLTARFSDRFATGPVSRARLDRLAQTSDALFAEVVAADGRVLRSSTGGPQAVGDGLGDPNFRRTTIGGRESVTIAAPVGRRTLVVGLPRAELTRLLTTALVRLPSTWPADMFAVDGTGAVISEWGAQGRLPGPLALTATEIAAAARTPLRRGAAAISTAPIAHTGWSFAIRAPRASTDAAITGASLYLPWALLFAVTLAAGLVVVLVLRGRGTAAHLAAERERAVAVLTVLNDGYLFVRDGRVVDVNDRLCALAGVAREDLLDAPESHPLVAAVVGGAPGDVVDCAELETVLTRADGSRVEVAVTRQQTPATGRMTPGRVSVVRDASIQKSTERRLSRLATTDALTGLGNRGAFDAALALLVGRAETEQQPLSLIVFDVDHFKAVNDRHGHPVGDEVLVEVGRRLSAGVREEDLVARIGGEEFACLLPGLRAREAIAIAERARAEVGGRAFGAVGALTISAGVCELDGHDAAGLYAAADAALLRAKREGRDRTARQARLTA